MFDSGLSLDRYLDSVPSQFGKHLASVNLQKLALVRTRGMEYQMIETQIDVAAGKLHVLLRFTGNAD